MSAQNQRYRAATDRTSESASAFRALNAAAEREAKIKPLRDAEMAKCKADPSNDPGYCERFWKGYGRV